MIQILIPKAPVPWAAHKGYGRKAYNPRDKERKIAVGYIRSQYTGFPIPGPVCLEFSFYLPIPKSYSKKKRASLLKDPLSHTTKPDITNMQKFTEDCLKKLVIEDDSQVVEMIAHKEYSEYPRTEISIRTME